MTHHCLQFLHGRVLPEDNLVQGIAVRAYDFWGGLGKDQVTDLTAGVHVVEGL